MMIYAGEIQLYYPWLQYCFWRRIKYISGMILDTVLLVTLLIVQLITSNVVVDPMRTLTMMVIAVWPSFYNVFPKNNNDITSTIVHHGRHGIFCEVDELPLRLVEDGEPLVVVVVVRIAVPDLDGS